MGFVLKINCKKKPFIVFHFWEFQKQPQEDISVSPQYWARAAASKVVEQQASPKNFQLPFLIFPKPENKLYTKERF